MISMKKRILLITLAIILIFPIGSVFAKDYHDVPKDHWAYEFIRKLSQDEVIKGYPDGGFHPEEKVAYLEVFKLFQGILEPSDEELKVAKENYGSIVEKAGVPDWARESMAFALQRRIITENTLESAKKQNLLVNGAKKVPDRSTIVVYLTRALRLNPSENFEVLKHKDIHEYNYMIKTHLVPLVEKGIFESTGSDGNFEGNRGVRRGEMAKIITLATSNVKAPEVVPPKDTDKDGNGKSFQQEAEEFLWTEAKEAFSSNYQVLRQEFKNRKTESANGKEVFTADYTLVMKNYDKDPDTVDYIKEAKEKGDPNYEKLKKEYLEPKEWNFKIKVEKTDTAFTLFTDTSNTDTPDWKEVKFQEMKIPENLLY
ncbi:MAG: S-layer homology domain-containing protein [Tissierellia bacterium]|nr:S-layer homology domain-containing protein [Tissierellia bacterium]